MYYQRLNSVHLKMIIPQNFRRTLKSYLTTLQDSIIHSNIERVHLKNMEEMFL